jgi:hypothetical protein
MITTKKALQEQIEELKQEKQELILACRYFLFDAEATDREKNAARAEVVLLREELAEMRDKLGEENASY